MIKRFEYGDQLVLRRCSLRSSFEQANRKCINPRLCTAPRLSSFINSSMLLYIFGFLLFPLFEILAPAPLVNCHFPLPVFPYLRVMHSVSYFRCRESLFFFMFLFFLVVLMMHKHFFKVVVCKRVV